MKSKNPLPGHQPFKVNRCGLTIIPSSCNYRPQRSWGKVMFLQASVILLTGGGAWPSQPPPDQAHPPPDQVHHHPPGPSTPPGPGTPPRPGTPPAQSMLGDTVNARAVRILLKCNLVVVVLTGEAVQVRGWREERRRQVQKGYLLHLHVRTLAVLAKNEPDLCHECSVR